MIEPIYNYKDINVEKNLEDEDSVFYYYQKLNSIKKANIKLLVWEHMNLYC